MGLKLNNGTGNSALGKNSVAIGQGCIALGKDQVVLGKYPEVPTGDASTDTFIVGAGINPNERNTALRINKAGEVLIGGGEVYMINPHTLEYCSVFILGTNNRIKKVHLSK